MKYHQFFDPNMKPPFAFFTLLVLILLGPPRAGFGQDGPGATGAIVDVEKRLVELGIELPLPAAPVANYVGAVRSGNLVFLAGAGPLDANGEYVTGRLGEDLDAHAGYDAARLAGISLLAALKAEIGDLNRVTRIVKVFGMVNSDPAFTGQSKVMNGFSDLMVEVFGDRGRHARSVAGMAALPLGFAVEVEMIVEVD